MSRPCTRCAAAADGQAPGSRRPWEGRRAVRARAAPRRPTAREGYARRRADHARAARLPAGGALRAPRGGRQLAAATCGRGGRQPAAAGALLSQPAAAAAAAVKRGSWPVRRVDEAATGRAALVRAWQPPVGVSAQRSAQGDGAGVRAPSGGPLFPPPAAPIASTGHLSAARGGDVAAAAGQLLPLASAACCRRAHCRTCDSGAWQSQWNGEGAKASLWRGRQDMRHNNTSFLPLDCCDLTSCMLCTENQT